MIFSDYLKEDVVAQTTDVDALIDPDPETPEGENIIADQVEAIMQTAAMEEASFFEGGEEAVDAYIKMLNEQVMQEGIISSVAKNNNIVRLNARDDLKRRTSVAAMILARKMKSPLWVKAMRHKSLYRKYKAQIIAKFSRRAFKIARISQAKHAVAAKKAEAPKFQRDITGMRTSMSSVLGR